MGAGRKRWKPDLRKPFNFYGARIVGGGERGTVAIQWQEGVESGQTGKFGFGSEESLPRSSICSASRRRFGLCISGDCSPPIPLAHLLQAGELVLGSFSPLLPFGTSRGREMERLVLGEGRADKDPPLLVQDVFQNDCGRSPAKVSKSEEGRQGKNAAEVVKVFTRVLHFLAS